MRLVILPQAFRKMTPLLLQQSIILFQDTSLVYTVGLMDFPQFGPFARRHHRPGQRVPDFRRPGLLRRKLHRLVRRQTSAEKVNRMISIKNVSKWYGDFQVLTDCSTEVAKGEVVVVCGPSGSGKSTLIKCVNALEPFQKGDIVVDGTSIADPKTNLPKLRSRVGMVFQHFELFPT